MSFTERYGPWAIVAGASDGTGAEFARQIAAKGVPSILIARREGPLADLAARIKADTGIECVTAAIDLAKPDAFERIRDAAGAREIGLFVSNAGSDPNGAKFLDRDIQTWLDLVQRNDATMMRCAHYFGGLMRSRKRGGILLVNSGACYGSARFMTTYSASKAFTLCFAEGLWDELRDFNVDVLTLVMGMTDTPALRELLEQKGLPTPPELADPVAVAALGLERLPHGPIQNWGIADDESGWAGTPAAARRQRVIAIGEASARVFGKE